VSASNTDGDPTVRQITIINHWNHAATGYDNDAERELASAIYQRTPAPCRARPR
jgi:hypothetical protein